MHVFAAEMCFGISTAFFTANKKHKNGDFHFAPSNFLNGGYLFQFFIAEKAIVLYKFLTALLRFDSQFPHRMIAEQKSLVSITEKRDGIKPAPKWYYSIISFMVSIAR